MRMMCKISTLIWTFLVQWLAISAGTWAAGNQNTRPPTEEELGAWLNVLRGAEVALHADKIQTAMAMISGVAARLDATSMPDEEKQAKLKELLKAIEVAVEEDNKVKAVALIDAIGETFEEHHGKLRVGEERHLQERAHHYDPIAAATERNYIGDQIKEAYTLLAKHEVKKAARIIRGFYHIIKENRNLASGEKAALFLHAIHETEKNLRANAAEKAEMALRAAASALQVDTLREGYVS